MNEQAVALWMCEYVFYAYTLLFICFGFLWHLRRWIHTNWWREERNEKEIPTFSLDYAQKFVFILFASIFRIRVEYTLSQHIYNVQNNECSAVRTLTLRNTDDVFLYVILFCNNFGPFRMHLRHAPLCFALNAKTTINFVQMVEFPPCCSKFRRKFSTFYGRWPEWNAFNTHTYCMNADTIEAGVRNNSKWTLWSHVCFKLHKRMLQFMHIFDALSSFQLMDGACKAITIPMNSNWVWLIREASIYSLILEAIFYRNWTIWYRYAWVWVCVCAV